jgi:hypothetical protein
MATEADMDIKKIDEITERIVTAADQIRAGKKSAPQHFEAVDIAVTFRIAAREYEARLVRAIGFSAVSIEGALEALRADIEAQARRIVGA